MTEAHPLPYLVREDGRVTLVMIQGEAGEAIRIKLPPATQVRWLRDLAAAAHDREHRR